MQRFFFLALFLFLGLAASAIAQPTGTLTGTVVSPDGTPVPAFVHITRIGNPGGPHPRPFIRTTQALGGVFTFEDVPVGSYRVMARHYRVGRAVIPAEITANETTSVSLTLQPPPGPGHDSLIVVELQGRAVVLQPDSLHPNRVAYFLEVDGDDTADYRLSFGPPWYNPPSGAQRPLNGDSITILGGTFGHGDRPLVIVYQINGLVWRDPRQGHGGYGGDHSFQYQICDGQLQQSLLAENENPLIVELHGDVLLDLCDVEPINAQKTTFDAEQTGNGPTHVLVFGTDDWGMIFRSTTVIGALLNSPDGELPFILVYEWDGAVIREPGDTTGLAGATRPDEAGMPGVIPTTYLTAKPYPNPFNPFTTIEYTVPSVGRVEVQVFDITGREVAKLVNTNQSPGTYSAAWDGSASPSGIYIYRVRVNDAMAAGRMVLMK